MGHGSSGQDRSGLFGMWTLTMFLGVCFLKARRSRLVSGVVGYWEIYISICLPLASFTIDCSVHHFLLFSTLDSPGSHFTCAAVLDGLFCERYLHIIFFSLHQAALQCILEIGGKERKGNVEGINVQKSVKMEKGSLTRKQ